MIRKMKILLTDATAKAAWDSLRPTIDDGAIAYWSRHHTNEHGLLEITELDEDNDPVAIHVLGIADVGDAIEKLLGGSVQVREDIRSNIYSELLLDEDEPALDQEMTDVIVQVALFGAIVYG